MEEREYQDIVISDMRDSIKKLLDGQEALTLSVVKMAEAFKSMDRFENRIESMEKDQKEKDREQDDKIAELRAFMYKAGGIWAGLMVAGSILMRFIGV